MNLKIAHIGDLKGLCFNIPDYQRGYRWETKQVCELLDDLLEFGNSKKNASNSGAFYCLQPLVVVENGIFNSPKEKVFDVIDGQQRLTTIFLIMNYLSDGEAPYRLRYDRASDKKQPVDFSNGEITYDKLKRLTPYEIENNPDFFYLSKAIEDIKNWFITKKTIYPKIVRKIDNVIVDENYNGTRDFPFYEDLSDKDKNDDQNDVRFIWYDATDASINYQGSISVFKRLNYGKTSLTAAELIKALLFQCDVYEIGQKAERKQVAFRMSTEWDRMEKALQNPFLWSMLTPQKKKQISKIDFVLSYVASQLAEQNDLEIASTSNDDDYDYIVFDKYIKKKCGIENGSESCSTYANVVGELWQRIQDVFDIIMSWYNDRELYHLIGLRLTLLNPRNNKRAPNFNEVLRDMFGTFESMTLQKFKDEQRKKSGEKINLNANNKKPQDGENPKTLADLSYGENDDELINILLVYNVTLCMKNTQDNQYFPFWFYQDTTPSLEHIHPQHLHDEDIDFDILCQWYLGKCNELENVDYRDNIQKEEIKNARALLDQVLLLKKDKEGEQTQAYKTYRKNKEKDFLAEEGKYRKALRKIDELFDELAGISQTELHSIRNMALVDKDTNAALGNGLMASKRQKLMELQNRFNETQGEEGAYTFTGTWKVFNKQFLDAKNNEEEATKASNLLFWNKKDRDDYFKDIETIYKEYVK